MAPPSPRTQKTKTPATRSLFNRNPTFMPNFHVKSGYTGAKFDGFTFKSQFQPREPQPSIPPRSAYKRFEQDIWLGLNVKYSRGTIYDLMAGVQNMWEELTSSERRPYEQEYEEDRKKYLAACSENKIASAQRKPVPLKNECKPNHDANRVRIDPSDNVEFITDQLQEIQAVKNTNGVRVKRNNELMQTIFSDTAVPDGRSVVTTQHLQWLQRKVASLTARHKKMNDELERMEERHQQKLQRLREKEQKFHEDLERSRGPPVTEDTINQMADRIYEEMRLERDLELERQRLIAAKRIENVENKGRLKTEKIHIYFLAEIEVSYFYKPFN